MVVHILPPGGLQVQHISITKKETILFIKKCFVWYLLMILSGHGSEYGP